MKEIFNIIRTGTIIERLSAYLKNHYTIIICGEYNTSMCMCCCRA